VHRVSFAGALSFNNLHDFERLAFYLGAAATQSLSSFQGRMAYPDTFIGLVDEEASERPSKRVLRGALRAHSCKNSGEYGPGAGDWGFALWVYAKFIPFPIRSNKPIPFIGNVWAYWKNAS
jgi:hypothetical protein